MIDLIYVEREVADHPRTRAVLARFPRAAVVPCERHGEIFNRHGQNFRLQKRRPALILARKREHHVLPAPLAYSIGGTRNYYFSHMLNCVYDCRYCFLQGMFQSAHYLLFVNYEDFEGAIDDRLSAAPDEDVYFFSGYDCDSLALEPATRFTGEFLPFFARRPRAWLELRTKSVQTRALLDREPIPNVVVAFSFTPEPVREAIEAGVPPVERRIEAMAELAERGWRIGLRFDPLVRYEGYQADYREMFERTLRAVPAGRLHSVSLGPFRLPRGVYKKMFRLFPEEPLLAGPLEDREGMVSYRREAEGEIVEFCEAELRGAVPEEKFFPFRLADAVEAG